MNGTPIFDELRDLLGTSPGRWWEPRATTGPGPRVDAPVSSPESHVSATTSSETGRAPAKIVVAGGRGVGKSTLVASVSDAYPVKVEGDTDFGRVSLHPDLALHLFSTSEPSRYGFGGALGAVVLVDPRRIEAAFATISYFENSADVPFIVVVNLIGGTLRHDLDEVREALALAPDVPLTTCDARNPASTAKTLQQLVSHAMNIGGPTPRAT